MTDMIDPKHRVAPKRTKPVDQNSQIVSKLRAFYSSVEEEPLPDVFLDLLEQLDSIEKARKA